MNQPDPLGERPRKYVRPPADDKASAGQIWFDADRNKVWVHDGNSWVLPSVNTTTTSGPLTINTSDMNQGEDGRSWQLTALDKRYNEILIEQSKKLERAEAERKKREAEEKREREREKKQLKRDVRKALESIQQTVQKRAQA